MIWKYATQGEIDEVTIRTDADWAGCAEDLAKAHLVDRYPEELLV